MSLSSTRQRPFPAQLHCHIPPKLYDSHRRPQASGFKFLFPRSVVAMFAYALVGATSPKFNIDITCSYFDWQVSSMAQNFNVLSPIFSTVVEPTLDYGEYLPFWSWPVLDNQARRTERRGLRGSFRNVTAIRVHRGLVEVLSRSLKSHGETPLELLPSRRSSYVLKGVVVTRPLRASSVNARSRANPSRSSKGTSQLASLIMNSVLRVTHVYAIS